MKTGDNGPARVVYFERPGTVTVRREAVTEAPGETVVTSRLIGISHGTEMLFYHGPFPTGQLLEQIDGIGSAVDYPIKYGYMNVGVTKAGRRVLAFAPHQDRFAAEESSLLAIPDDLADEAAILYPSVETALQIVHDASPALGETVLVTGLGVIGLLVTRLLRRMSITVIAAEPVAARRERATEHGCTVVDPRSVGSNEIRKITNGRGVDVAVNTSANAGALQLAIDSLAREGLAVEASWYGEERATLDLGASFHRRRLTIRASQVSHLNPRMQPRWSHARRTDLVWQLIRELAPERLITHRFPLDDAARAYELISRQPEELLQVVLEP